MSKELPKYFEFKDREAALYDSWEASGAFKPEFRDGKEAFNIAMPPPNANGELHLGHAFGYTVMDILGRFHRMKGEKVLLLPGKDHAGIQTQVVFEKKLKGDGVDCAKKDTKWLYDQCYDFCIDRAQYMRSQEKRLGLSADWSRELFTLDPRLNDIIFETFEKMWADGLVYKGSRIVNWSVFSQTSISDVEVEYKEQEGTLWYIVYPLEEPTKRTSELKLPSGNTIALGEQGLVVATTRPETMLGDTALAVHPDDDRYRSFIGKRAKLPLTNRLIPIIADKRIDPAFGTGVVKVTPAHDFADYDIGVDHKLEALQVIGKDGKMTAMAGEKFAGQSTQECRKLVLELLTKESLLVDETSVKHKVPIGERGKDIIEPLISEQWFVNVDKPGNSLKKRALDLLRSGAINVYPSRFMVLFEQWLENLRDWNISRQLWWGHRLPVWYRNKGKDSEEIHVGRMAPSGEGWEQEKDVFDTWFSSGQWAYSTMAASGFLNLKSDNKDNQYFPTHTMVMGRDILFFWACRMLLLSAYRLGDVPWKNIFFTGLIRDEHGQKMSKSKGNGIDPLEMIDQFGSDSLRLGLVMGASPGNDLSLSVRKIEGYSKFANKIWNAAKLFEIKLGDSPSIPLNEVKLSSSNWILGKLEEVFNTVTSKLNSYEVSIAADEIYNFTWFTFCDWYLEMIKVSMDKGDSEAQEETRTVAREVFKTILTLLHPFVPFVTEEIFQNLSNIKDSNLLISRDWKMPDLKRSKVKDDELFEAMETISGIRSVKAALTISAKRTPVCLERTFSAELIDYIRELSKVDLVEESKIPPERALRKPILGSVVICDVEGKENYRKRLEKEIETHKASISGIEKKLSGAFATQAKPEIVEKERERLEHSLKAVSELEGELLLFK